MVETPQILNVEKVKCPFTRLNDAALPTETTSPFHNSCFPSVLNFSLIWNPKLFLSFGTFVYALSGPGMSFSWTAHDNSQLILGDLKKIALFNFSSIYFLLTLLSMFFFIFIF